MSHLHRFYIAQFPTSAQLALPPEEAHHALRVVRVREGDQVALFDGRGREYTGKVARCTKNDVEVEIESRREVPKPEPELNLAIGWPHLDKSAEFIVRHGTELGVARFIFFHAARSQRPPKLSPKWERLAIECCKQSGRLWLPEFQIGQSLDDVLDEARGCLVMASIEGPYEPLAIVQGQAQITLLIGPEGDFTGEETALACARGAQLISLGAAILRTEVAAIVAATLVQYEAGVLRAQELA